MQSQDRQTEIEALELELAEKEILLETFLNANELFLKTKVLFHEIRTIKDRLEELKGEIKN
ncbi:MAG TPA: hypothetical protein VGO21_06000 [Candidatus Paceibacterota bacterium]|jgi:hypothetical protein|nr:hypothetical protein [Candidatus Paceibacterota bacterium]